MPDKPNDKGLGSEQRAALRFARLYTRESWHSYSEDYETKRVINSLAKRGLVEIDYRYSQFRVIEIGV